MLICFPWEMKHNFRGKVSYKQDIMSDLYKRGYRIQREGKKTSDNRTIDAARDAIIKIDKMKKAKEMPWLFMVSDDSTLFVALRELLPVTWCLTNKVTVYSVDNQYLMDNIYRNVPPKFDPWDEGERTIVDTVKYSGLLYWQGVTDPVPGLHKYAGMSLSLLRERIGRRWPTVFTHNYKGKMIEPEDMENVYQEVSDCLGVKVSNLIEEHAVARRYHYGKKAKKDRFGEAKT